MIDLNKKNANAGLVEKKELRQYELMCHLSKEELTVENIKIRDDFEKFLQSFATMFETYELFINGVPIIIKDEEKEAAQKINSFLQKFMKLEQPVVVSEDIKAGESVIFNEDNLTLRKV